MNIQKQDLITDLFAEAVFSVKTISYRDMNESDRLTVDKKFFMSLIEYKIKVNNDELESFKEEHPTSFINHTLSDYVNNSTYSKMNDVDLAVNSIEKLKGEKVTLVKFSDFGFPVVIHTRLVDVVNKKYAQYNDALWLTHKPKRKRTNYRNILTGREALVVFNDWIELNKDAYFNIETSKDVTVKQSKYRAFDINFITDMINSSKNEPIFKLNV